ncbi:MAG TPA: DUF748 domain-containing protein [Sunxiuqinia sp.]|nr:DUF748 domain-containing protein [Sunxiuqinia sp.]
MNQKKKHTWKRIVKWILAVLLLLVILASVFVIYFSEKIIKQELTQLVDQKSNGAFSLTYDGLSVNPLNQSISLESLKLTRKLASDTVQHEAGYFAANSFTISKINFYRLFLLKKLFIKEVSIDSPSWNSYLEAKKSKNQDEGPFAVVRELSPVFNKYLKSIKIENIKLTHAGFINNRLTDQQGKTLKPLNFNVGISNFYTDSAIINGGHDFFDADDIYLSIDNYHKLMADSLHELKIEKIQYSLKNKDIRGSNIKLSPIDTTNHSKTQYEVEIPEIKIKSKDLRTILQQDTIAIDSLFLEKANILVIPQKNAPGINLKKIKEFDLYQLVEGEFARLKINYLALNANKLRIERIYDENSSTQEFDHLKVRLNNFLLSENAYSDRNKVLYSSNLVLNVGHYYLLMNDKIHRFDASNIKVSSKGNIIQADNLLLKPLQNPKTKQTTVDMHCDSIRLMNVDLKRLYHTRVMPLQSITAYHPNVSIDQGVKQQKNNIESSSLLYHFIKNYIKGIYANVVSFDQGKFAINTREGYEGNGIIACNFNFKLTDFSLDSISARKSDKLFFATNLDLNFSNYRMKLADQIHRLEIEQIKVSTHDEQASLKNLHLFPDKPGQTHRLLREYHRSQIYDIKVPYLVLRNTNIHQAFFRKNLSINHFSIIEPKISIEVFPRQQDQDQNTSPREFYELLKNYIKNINIGKISAPNGSIKVITHSKKGKTISFNNKFSIELEHFKLNDEEIKKKRLLFSDDFNLKIEDHLFQLSDNVHYLQASEIGISSKKSEMYIKNAILYPDITSKTYGNQPWHLHVKIPEIRLEGVDLEEAYFNKRLAVDEFFIKNPLIKLYRSKGHHKAPKFGEVSVPLPKELQLLSIKKFNLNDGKIVVFNSDQLNDTEILNSELSMTGENNRLVSRGVNQPANFKSDNISTTLINLIYKPEKNDLVYNAQKVHFSTKGKDLEIKGLNVKNYATGSPVKFVNLTVPSLKFEALKLDEVLNDKVIHFQSVQAERPELTLNQLKTNQSGVNLYNLRVPDKLTDLVEQFSANEVDVSNGHLILNHEGKSKQINNINIALEKFHLDTIPSSKLLGSESVKLTLHNYAFSDSKKLYNFHFDNIGFDNFHNKLSVAGLSIVPRYSRDKFQKVIRFQTDHYQGKIGSIELSNIDLKRWYNKHELVGSQVAIYDPSIQIYRDKRTPLNENQRPQLPQELIKNIELPFHFDSLTFDGGNIVYTEQAPNMPKPGKVNFKNLNLTVFPLTNMKDKLKNHPTLTVKANALLMGKSLLKTTMTYNMQSPIDQFHVEGSLAPCELTMLNPITRNEAGIAIKSGQLNRFDFDFDADNQVANGKLRFAYDNLKVTILEHKDGNTKEAKFASFLTNSLVLKSKHPRTRILLPDDIHFKRDQKKSVINYWWKSIFSGAKNTFGIKENKE